MALIHLDNASVEFSTRRFKNVGLKDYLLKGLFRQRVNPRIVVRALDSIDLTLRDGDSLGVIGHNGAGKSTLLKLIAGVYPPTQGTCITQGKVAALFDLTLGFERDASGWENIRYRAYLLGETPRTLQGKLEPIAQFSELGEYLEMPVRYYSSGMIVRLGFSIATAIEPEILVVDEILAAGDASFRDKARRRMTEMIQQARITVLASHDLRSLEEFCTRILWLEKGRIKMLGPAGEVVDAYCRHYEIARPRSQAA